MDKYGKTNPAKHSVFAAVVQDTKKSKPNGSISKRLKPVPEIM
jgi:hypothetical protein